MTTLTKSAHSKLLFPQDNPVDFSGEGRVTEYIFDDGDLPTKVSYRGNVDTTLVFNWNNFLSLDSYQLNNDSAIAFDDISIGFSVRSIVESYDNIKTTLCEN